MNTTTLPAEKTLLLVDDDKPFVTRLARAMEASVTATPAERLIIAALQARCPSVAPAELGALGHSAPA